MFRCARHVAADGVNRDIFMPEDHAGAGLHLQVQQAAAARPGAAAGGAVISSGMGYSVVPVMGAMIAALGLLLVLVSGRRQPERVCVPE
jgi:predicted MFS family arabinose efflux permease